MSAMAILAIASTFTTASASKGKNANTPAKKAVLAVYQNFPQAQLVHWQESNGTQIAIFTEADCAVRATFTKNGRLLSTLITADGHNLPFEVQNSLRKKYPGYVPQSVTEYINNTDHDYYVLLKNQEGNQINWIRVSTDEDGNSIQVIQNLHQTI